MLPPKRGTSSEQRELLALFRCLDARARGSLLDFARFLAKQAPDESGPEEEVPSQPLGLQRPPEESVIEAMRRLSRNYPMLDKGELLHQASTLMSSHVLQGRAAAEVIDDLETLFAEAWQKHDAGNRGESKEKGKDTRCE